MAVVEPRLKRHCPPPPPPLQSRGPWLARGFCCPAGSSLPMASCETLAPLPAPYALYAGSWPDGLVWAGSERFPNLLRLSLPLVPPSVPRWTDRVHLAVPSSIALAFTFFAEARHPHAPRRRFSRGSRNEAAKFALCYGPTGLLALHRHGRLRPSLHPPGSPRTSVGYHYAGTQPIPAAGLTPARHAALWAACKARRYQRLRRWCAKKDPLIPGVPESPRLSSSEDFVPWSEAGSSDPACLCALCLPVRSAPVCVAKATGRRRQASLAVRYLG